MRSLRTLFLVLVIGLTFCMSIYTTSAAATPIVPSVVPSEPFGITGSNWNGVAHLSWQEPNQTGPGITRYDVYREINGTGAVPASASERHREAI
jgi:hypothetical protein